MKTEQKRKKILLVDDDCIFILIHRRALELAGVQADIRTAGNGIQALELLQKYSAENSPLPDIILLDLFMPGMDGFSFLSKLAELSLPEAKKMQIVIISSSADPRDKNRAKELGIKHYLQKPVPPTALVAMIDSLAQ